MTLSAWPELSTWPEESSCLALAVGGFCDGIARDSSALPWLVHLKAICCHESIGSPSPSRVAAANRSLATQLTAAESSALEPEDDLIETCDGVPVLGSQKTTTAMVPSSAIRTSGQRVLGLYPKEVCAAIGLAGTGLVWAALMSAPALRATQ